MAVDSTGNVKGRVGTVEQDAVQVHRRGQSEARSVRKEARSSENQAPLDTVDLEVGRTIQETIDPALFDSERKAKVARIKEQLEKGQYSVPSQELARAISEEIQQEIYFARVANGSGSDE